MPVAFAPLQSISLHQGPLPPPQVLDGYEKVHPGSAAWILQEAQTSAEHVRRMEARGVEIQARDLLLHRVLPFALVTGFLIASVILAIFASPVLGGIAFFTTLGSVVTVYLRGALGTAREPGDPTQGPQKE